MSRAVAEHYMVDRVSFGDAVRSQAKRRGLPEGRGTLQDLGDELIAVGWDAFCTLVIGQADWDGRSSLVVDGVRHPAAIAALQGRAEPSRLYVVFIEASWERRTAWLVERGVTGTEAETADAHPNESELDAVRDRADVVVPNDGDLERVVANVVRALDGAGGLG